MEVMEDSMKQLELLEFKELARNIQLWLPQQKKAVKENNFTKCYRVLFCL